MQKYKVNAITGDLDVVDIQNLQEVSEEGSNSTIRLQYTGIDYALLTDIGTGGTYGRLNAVGNLASTSYVNTGVGTRVPFTAVVYSSGMTPVSTHSFTVTATGRYRASWLLLADSAQLNDDGIVHIVQNGVSMGSVFYNMLQSTGVNQTTGNIDVNLTAGSTIALHYQGSPTSDTIIFERGSYFDIVQIGTPNILSNPTLQEVTDNGNTTTNDITLLSGGTAVVLLSDNVGSGNIAVQNTPITNITALSPTALTYYDTVGNIQVTFPVLTANRVQTLQDANGTIALTSDIPTPLTNEQIQDSAFAILTDTTTIDLTYDDAGNQVTASVINGSIGNTQLGANIDATKIADGTITNIEYQYLNGVTSAIQTQFDNITTNFVENAQDAVGSALTDTTTIDFTYTDGTNQISAIVIDDSIDNVKLSNMGANTVKVNNTNVTGNPVDLTITTNTLLGRKNGNIELIPILETDEWIAPPLISTSTGLQGQKAYDNLYVYFCTQNDFWVRVSRDLTIW